MSDTAEKVKAIIVDNLGVDAACFKNQDYYIKFGII